LLKILLYLTPINIYLLITEVCFFLGVKKFFDYFKNSFT